MSPFRREFMPQHRGNVIQECACQCLSRAVMSVCGHHKEPHINDVDMAGSLRVDVHVLVHIYLLLQHLSCILCLF